MRVKLDLVQKKLVQKFYLSWVKNIGSQQIFGYKSEKALDAKNIWVQKMVLQQLSPVHDDYCPMRLLSKVAFPNEKLAQIYLSYSLLEVTIFIYHTKTHNVNRLPFVKLMPWTKVLLKYHYRPQVLNLLVALGEGSYCRQLLNPPGTLWTEVWQPVFCCQRYDYKFRKYVVFHILSVLYFVRQPFQAKCVTERGGKNEETL